MSVRSILLRITGDATEGKKTIADMTRDVAAFGKESATATLEVNAKQARADIAATAAQLKALPRSETIRIQVTAETAKLAALEAKLRGLQSQGGFIGPQAEAAASKLAQRLGTVARQIEVSRTRVQSLAHDFENLADDTERFGRRLLNALSGAAAGAGQLASSFLAMGPAVGIMGLLLVAVVALAPALGAALIGVLALGVAFLAALGPIALILVLVGSKIKDLLAAQASLKTSTLQLAQAQAAAHTERIAALQAERDATLALGDAQNGLADARLNVRSTALAILQAKQALAQFDRQHGTSGNAIGGLVGRQQGVDVVGGAQQQQGANSSSARAAALERRALILQVAQAQQQHRDAVQGVADSTNNLAKAQATANGFAEKGAKAYPPYADALKQVAAAEKSIAASQKVIGGSAGFLGTIDKFKVTLKELFGPAIKNALEGLGKALQIISKHADVLRGPLGKLGAALGTAFVSLAKGLTNPQVLHQLSDLIVKTAKFVPSLVQFGKGVAGILLGVADTALPHLTSGLGKLGDKFVDVAKHPKEIRDFINDCIDKLKTTISWVGKLGSAFVTISKTINAVLAPIVSALSSIQTAISAISAISNANQSATQAGNASLRNSAKQIAADRQLLGDPKAFEAARAKGAGHLSTAAFRQFLLDSIATLESQVANTKANLPGGKDNKSGFWYNLIKTFSPAHASGGFTTGAHFGWVGESGNEGIIPFERGGAERIADLLARALFSRGPSMSVPPGGFSPASQGSGWTGDQHNHFHGGSADPQHAAEVIGRRMSWLGGGYRA